MATVPMYQKQIQPNIQPTVNLAQAPAAAFGGGVAEAVGEAGSALFKQALKVKEKEDSDAVLQTSNAMLGDMLNFANGENGVLTLQGNNAKGATQKYQEFYTKTFNDYAGKLKNDRQKAVFAQHMKENSYNYMRSIASHERTETQKAREQEINTGLTLNNDGIAANYNNPDLVKNYLQRNSQLMQISAQEQGWDKDTTSLMLQKQNFLGVKSAVQAAIDSNNYDQANKLLEGFKTDIGATNYNTLKASVNKGVQKNNDFLLIDDIVKSSLRPDGTVDREKADGMLRDRLGPQGKVNFDTFKDALVQQESGGDYNATGTVQSNGDYAIGKYQIMKSNWSQWAQDAGLSPDAKPTKENQEIIANAKLKPLFDKYGAAGAAVAWYAGEENAQRWLDGKETAIDSNGNEYSWDSPQGDAPSIRGYVDSISANAGTAFDAGRYSAVQEKLNARISDITKIKADQDKEYKQGLSESIDTAETLEQGLSIIDDSDLPIQTKNSLKGALKTKFNASVNGTGNQKFFATYERTGLYKDVNTLKELDTKLAAGEDITPEKQTKYDNAIFRYNRYQQFLQGGGYEPVATVSEQKEEKQAESDAEKEMFSAISELANRGLSRAEIEAKIKEVSEQYGYDADYFINNTEWDKIGTKRGGVK